TYVYGKIMRKYVKVIITADIKSKKLIAVDAKISEVSEPKVAAKHIKLLKGNRIKLRSSTEIVHMTLTKYSMQLLM
ncbi:MAG: hypothetical protein RXQ93_06655, partial [Caldisphaera sp.]